MYDPATDSIRFIADLTDAVGETGKNCIAQGKSHVGNYDKILKPLEVIIVDL